VSPVEPNPTVSAFLDAWRHVISHLFSQVGVKSIKVELLDAAGCGEPLPSGAGGVFRAAFQCSGSLRGTLAWVTTDPQALQLAQARKSESLNRAAEFNQPQRAVVAEFLSQAAERTMTLWEAKSQKKAGLTATTGPEKSGSVCGGLRISGENFPAVTLALELSDEFRDSLQQISLPSSALRNAAGPPPPTADEIPLPSLDLLFDVELDATIRFGGCQLPLRDILSMNPGSIVELDHRIDDSAELLVAGRLVARGEVVVVEGCFGLRVTELVSARERTEFLQPKG
jgi:flagellar motor switch protein FliN